MIFCLVLLFYFSVMGSERGEFVRWSAIFSVSLGFLSPAFFPILRHSTHGFLSLLFRQAWPQKATKA